MMDEMKQIEENLYQTKNRSGQDPLNFPIRLNNKLAALASEAGRGDYRPTDQAIAVRTELTAAIDSELNKLNKIFNEQVPQFNKIVKEKDLDAVVLK